MDGTTTASTTPVEPPVPTWDDTLVVELVPSAVAVGSGPMAAALVATVGGGGTDASAVAVGKAFARR